MHLDNLAKFIIPSIFGQKIQHMTQNILMKMNPFKLEIPEITKTNGSGKTLPVTFILIQPIQEKQESI